MLAAGVLAAPIVRATGWQSLGPEGGNIDLLVGAPDDGRVLYAGTAGGLFRSADSGRSWARIGAALGRPSRAPAADPLVPGVVLASTENGVSRSTDRGTTWVTRLGGLTGGATVYDFGHSRRVRGVVLGLSYTGGPGPPGYRFHVVRSVTGGASWRVQHRGLPTDLAWHDVASDGSDPETWYLASESGLYGSKDGGRSWRRLALAERRILQVEPDPVRTQRLWALVDVAPTSGSHPEVLCSTDGGRHWQRRGPGSPAGRVLRILADPVRRDRLYLVTESALWHSENAGRSWREVLRRRSIALVADRRSGALTGADREESMLRSVDGDRWTVYPRAGIRARAMQAVAAGGGETLWAVESGSNAVWHSPDAGATWSRATPLDAGASYPRGLVAAADAPGVAYLASSLGLQVTRDGGATWEATGPSGAGPVAYVFALAMDPTESDRLYVADGAGLHRSENGGATWQLLRPFDPARPQPWAMAVAAGTPRQLFADGPFHIYGHPQDSLYRSADEGTTWSGLLQVPGRVTAIVVDHRDRSRIWVSSAWSDPLVSPRSTGRIDRSTDGGGTWVSSSVEATSPPVWSLVQDPGARGTLYAAAARGVFASHDRGATWQRIGRPAAALALPPDGARRLYAATGGGIERIQLTP